MASVKLPWDVEEEILSRLPPRSLVRFRTVCKQWNGLFNDKRFVNNHLACARPQFIFLTESKKMYSIEIDPRGTIGLQELPYDFPCQPTEMEDTTITACDGLLFRNFFRHGIAVWNPWLRQVAWFDYKKKRFKFVGVGYDSSRPEMGYKILGYFFRYRRVRPGLEVGYKRLAIYECSSRTLRYIDDAPYEQWPSRDPPLSVNGNLYWLSFNGETREFYIRIFDFSKEIFKPFCLLPCPVDFDRSEVVLSVFKEDRLSLFRQCFETGKIEIWETKTNIDREEDAVWINLMTLPTTNLPKLVYKICGIRYFIFDKTLIMCCADGENKVACVYMVRGDMFKKIQIHSGIAMFSHCLYLPCLVSVPYHIASSSLL
ncbi:hypothetical protein CARUB_v10016087mg [Capsella rubella]|uniref:F-box domain-containing protein n=1 Tax=Capsella rubella TaxID=81985 RepID=R0GAP1_9BRAS|nr:F-box protein At3g17710 [Capsella rubella]EOA32777.1 hypothetical protein CARUB_v10016087mg [Capsella rubella]